MNRRSRGFSLIEVLLVVTLLAAGLALAFAVLRNATQATGRAEVLAQRSERLRAVQAFVRRQLDAAMPLPMEFDEGTGEARIFVASADELQFVAPMPGYLSRGGPYVQRFRLVRAGGTMRLEFEHRLLTPEGPADSEREPEVLLDGIADGRFETRRFTENGSAGAWTTDWDTVGELPRLVRLQLRMQEPGAAWPTLVAAPRMGQNPPPLLADAGDPGAPPAEEEQ